MLNIASRSTSAEDLRGSSVTTSESRPTLSVPPVLGPDEGFDVLLLLPPQLASVSRTAHAMLRNPSNDARVRTRRAGRSVSGREGNGNGSERVWGCVMREPPEL